MILYNRELIEILPLSDLYRVYGNHKRLEVFAHKGRECVTCDREGTLLLKTRAGDGAIHIDLYTDDFVMMTVDHITPKSIGKLLGWARRKIEDLTNKQPMCIDCNSAKGNSTISTHDFRMKRLQYGYPRKKVGKEVIRQLVGNNNIFDRSLT